MELTQLLQFKTIAECQSLTQAARLLYISQPTLSTMLKKLEAELGVQLFDRTKNKIILNDAGRLALRRVRPILDQADAMKEELSDFAGREKRFRVGFCDAGPMWYCVPKFSMIYPELELKNALYRPEEQECRLLLNGKFDLLVTAGPIEHHEVASLPFLRDQTLLSVPAESPAASLQWVSLKTPPVTSLALFNLDGAFSRLKAGFFQQLRGASIETFTDYFLFSQRIRNSSVATTTTRIVQTYRDDGKNRVLIPVTDPELSIDYFISYLTKDRPRLVHVLAWLNQCAADFGGQPHRPLSEKNF